MRRISRRSNRVRLSSPTGLSIAGVYWPSVSAPRRFVWRIIERLPEFDIVITCTASQLPILGLGLVERAIKARRHRPMFMVDLAVPRDVEVEVGQLDDVFLHRG